MTNIERCLSEIDSEKTRLEDAARTWRTKHGASDQRLRDALMELEAASSGSWIGYQSRVSYAGFQRPPRGARFDSFSGEGIGDWREYTDEDFSAELRNRSQVDDMESLDRDARDVSAVVEAAREEASSSLDVMLGQQPDKRLVEYRKRIDELRVYSSLRMYLEAIRPSQINTIDYGTAMSEGVRPPHHVRVQAWHMKVLSRVEAAETLAGLLGSIASYLRKRKAAVEAFQPRENGMTTSTRVFIGHGGSLVWRDLKDFLVERLKLEYDEFNRESTPGVSTVERLETMLKAAGFAFLVLTAEDEHSDGSVHARENVVHEAGLFQGRLGFKKAILLVEEGCAEFSNVHGLTQIRFPKGNISAKFEEVRRVLEREKIIAAS